MNAREDKIEVVCMCVCVRARVHAHVCGLGEGGAGRRVRVAERHSFRLDWASATRLHVIGGIGNAEHAD